MKAKCAPCLRAGLIRNAITIVMGQAVCEDCFRQSIKIIDEEAKKKAKK